MEYFYSIFFGTFVLEDVALALALALVAEAKIALWPAFLATFLGISIGDMGLYALGYFIGKLGIENRFKFIKKFRSILANNKRANFLTYSVIISRFVPGTRFATYVSAGLLHYPLMQFTFLTILTVFAWVALAFGLGHSLRSILSTHLLLTLILVFLGLKLVKFLVTKLSDPWERKALLHSWRQWMAFEFWPAALFYIPIVPYYIYLSIRYLSPLAPFYANPEIENGGLIGESKWDFLKHLDKNTPSTLKSFRIEKQSDLIKVKELLDFEGLSYPFILKPDVGQRGFGVRIIRSEENLKEYLALADFDIIAQKLSQYQNEAGVFFVRRPHEKEGFIFSITDKRFPSVIGDGKTKLGDLILQDPRARIIASTYFSRLGERLDEIIDSNERVYISECGNHCQGAIFLNGKELNTESLRCAIQKSLSQIPNFYFGRVDIRYKDVESLKNGTNFEIVEINGAGSEATHIWDAKTKLYEAYRTLFKQWKFLFEIGADVKKSKIGSPRVKFLKFALECLRVYFRKEALSISS